MVGDNKNKQIGDSQRSTDGKSLDVITGLPLAKTHTRHHRSAVIILVTEHPRGEVSNRYLQKLQAT